MNNSWSWRWYSCKHTHLPNFINMLLIFRIRLTASLVHTVCLQTSSLNTVLAVSLSAHQSDLFMAAVSLKHKDKDVLLYIFVFAMVWDLVSCLVRCFLCFWFLCVVSSLSPASSYTAGVFNFLIRSCPLPPFVLPLSSTHTHLSSLSNLSYTPLSLYSVLVYCGFSRLSLCFLSAAPQCSGSPFSGTYVCLFLKIRNFPILGCFLSIFLNVYVVLLLLCCCSFSMGKLHY